MNKSTLGRCGTVSSPYPLYVFWFAGYIVDARVSNEMVDEVSKEVLEISTSRFAATLRAGRPHFQ